MSMYPKLPTSDDNISDIALTLEEIKKLNEREETESAFNEKWKTFGGISTLAIKLATSLTKGISPATSDNLQKRRQDFGSNTASAKEDVPASSKITFCQLFVLALNNQKLLIIRVALVCEFIPWFLVIINSLRHSKNSNSSFDDNDEDDRGSFLLYLFTSLIPVVLVPFGFMKLIAFVNYRQQKSIQEFATQVRNSAEVTLSVLRDGEIMLINKMDLVAGDVYLVKSGEIIYADGLIIHADEFSNDFSQPVLSVTVENVSRAENDSYHFIEAGTKVVSGSAKILVTAIEPHVRQSQRKELYVTTSAVLKTNKLDEDVARISRGIITAGFVLGFIVFILLVVRFTISKYAIDREGWQISHANRIVTFFFIGGLIFVTFLQKSFPITVVLSQILGLSRMKRNNFLVKNLDDIQTLGDVTTVLNLCDKVPAEVIKKFEQAGISLKTMDQVDRNQTSTPSSTSESQASAVESLMYSGEIVAVIGQNPADCLALQKAHLGILISKAADMSSIFSAHIISTSSEVHSITDQMNLILKLTNESRNLRNNISMFLQFLIPMIVVIGITTTMCSLVTNGNLGAVHIVWISFVGFLFGLAFAHEGPGSDDEFIKKKTRNQGLISAIIWRNILGQIIYQGAIVVLIIFYHGQLFHRENIDLKEDDNYLTSQLFTIFALMTIFNAFNCRQISGGRNIFANVWKKSKMFLAIWVLMFVVQLLIGKFGDQFVALLPLHTSELARCLVFGVGTLIWGQIINTIPVCTRGESTPPSESNEQIVMKLL